MPKFVDCNLCGLNNTDTVQKAEDPFKVVRFDNSPSLKQGALRLCLAKKMIALLTFIFYLISKKNFGEAIKIYASKAQ